MPAFPARHRPAAPAPPFHRPVRRASRRTMKRRDFRVQLFRTPDRSLSRGDARDAAARLFRVPVGVLAGPAEVSAHHDLAHRDDRCVRSAALRHAGRHRRLVVEGAAGGALDAGGAAPAAARRRAHRQHRPGGAAVDDQAADAVRQLSDAAALEVPPSDARAEHELLPGRVRRPHRDQGDADRARRARHLADRRRATGLRDHLLRHAARGAGKFRRPPARPVPRLGGAVRRRACTASCRVSGAWRAYRPTRAR